ncbi:MAG: transposase [Thermodesulfobacteriota bacterium]
MIRTRDPRQALLIDPWSHLGPRRRRLLEDSWAGLFRREILSELPAEELAASFRTDFGRPAKDLQTVLGVLLLQQMHDLTDLETVNQQWHFALDIPSESDAAKYLCPKTLWTMRQKVTDLKLEAVSPPAGLPQSAGLSLSDFQISPEGRGLACPQGEAPLSCSYRKKKERYHVTFSSARCEECPEKTRCPVKPAKKYHYLSYYVKAGRVAARRAYQQTEEFRDRYRWRAGIEGTMSELDRRTGAKDLRVRGQEKVSYCFNLKATALNILRASAVLLAITRAGEAVAGSASGFSRLLSRVKEQFRALTPAIIDFFLPEAYPGPVTLKMAA